MSQLWFTRQILIDGRLKGKPSFCDNVLADRHFSGGYIRSTADPSGHLNHLV